MFEDIEPSKTNILDGTSAAKAFELYCKKLEMIESINYECKLLIDKYHEEMCNAQIPFIFSEEFLTDMFSKEESECKSARAIFLHKCFSEGFLKNHQVDIVCIEWHGYDSHAASINLRIGDFFYSVEIPIPKNIIEDDAKKNLVGKVKFRADRLHCEKVTALWQVYKAIQFPTYDWKACFSAIEKNVEDNERCSSK